MKHQRPSLSPPLGLLELDPEGVVVRYDPTPPAALPRESVVGRDFFTEVMPADHLYGFRARFLAFMDGGRRPRERFALRVPCEGGALRLQVMLAADGEQGAGGPERLALVRVTPERTQGSLESQGGEAMVPTPNPNGAQFKVVCAWCGVLIRVRERKDSEGMCGGCFRRLLDRHTHPRQKAKASDR